MLSQYFHPLNIALVLFVVAALFFFDAIGTWFDSRYIKSPAFLRPAVWLYGMGLFVAVWFGLHFFIPFRADYILFSTLPLLYIALPPYLHFRRWKELWIFAKSHRLPLIIFFILSPALFVKSSLPPYLTDEMAYHFWSPYDVKHELVWNFGTGYYQNLPKLIDTMMVLPFALTKTYAPSRLLHFLLFYSGVTAIYAWLKLRFGFTVSALFALMYLFINQNLLIIATSGYIDYSMAILITLAVITLLDVMIFANPASFLAGSIFWGLSIGGKYTALLGLTAYTTIFSAWYLYQGKKYLHIRNLAKFLMLLLIFGGYWYVKNLLYTGNPIYPFLFGCKFAQCYDISGVYTGSWTIPIKFANSFKIISSLTYGHPVVVALFIVALLLLKLHKTVIFLLIGAFIELFLTRNFSGFFDRYFLHLQTLLIIILVLPAVRYKLYLLPIIALAVFLVFTTLKTTYSPWNYLSPQEVYYAIGKTNIYHWLKDRHKQNGDIIAWCGTSGEKDLYILDEGILYTRDEQPMSVLVVNCRYIFPKPGQLATADQPVWFASHRTCDSGSDLETRLVCQAKPLGRYLYFYEPKGPTL